MKLSNEECATATIKKLDRKLFVCWGITVSVYFLCLLFDGLAHSISLWTAKYIPSIAKLNTEPAPLNGFTGNFFGVASLLIPFYLLSFGWQENILMRFRHLQPKSGRGLIETIVVVYVLGLPFLSLVFFIFYAAPLELSDNPRLSGQVVLHNMLNSYFGLFVFGTVLIPALALLAAIFIAYIWLPFSAVIYYFSTKDSK